MARVMTSGFELGNFVGSGQEWNNNVGANIQSTVARSGTYALRISSLSSGAGKYVRGNTQSNGPGPLWCRAYVRFDTLPSAENRFIALAGSVSLNTSLAAYLTVDASGVVRLYDEDGQIGSGSAPISTGVWACVELHVNKRPAAGSHVVRARVDTVEFAGATNRDLSSDFSIFFLGGNLAAEAQTTGDWYFDDSAVNDNVGRYQSSWPGLCKGVVHLKPSAAGDTNSWTNDYTAVDEVTPNDATDFQASNTLNQISEHNIEDPPVAIDSADAITCIGVGVRFSGAAASANASFVTRVRDNAAGNVEESSVVITPGATAYRTNDAGGGVPGPKLVLYDMPGSAMAPIKKADLTNFQIGYRVSTANTNNAQISTVWLQVEYAAPLPPPTRDNMMAMMNQ